jgi:hypothetical protein
MLLNTTSQNNFIEHNKIIFDLKKNKLIKKEKFFLIEFHKWHILHVINSYFMNLIKKDSIKIIAYANYRIHESKNHFFDNLKWIFGKFFNIRNFAVYRSFGTDDFIIANPTADNFAKAKIISFKLLKKIKKKNDIINISIDDVWIGDLIYDSYLKSYSLPTINISSERFKIFLIKSIALFLFWKDFFKSHNIEGVACAHSVYLDGLPVRIAAINNIVSYNLDNNKIYRICRKDISKNKGYSGSWSQFRFYKKEFKKLPNKNLLLKLGKKNLKEIISGKKKYHYITNISPPDQNYRNQIIKKSKRLKVFIFAHSFFDSPHVFGKFLFTDFYEWLKFLKNVSLETDYDWYIKPHPNSRGDLDLSIIKQLFKNSNIRIVLDQLSLNSIFRSGIDCILTVHGTIASEFSYYGKKVINASYINPHKDYKFSFTPKNISSYKKMIKNLDKNKFLVNKKELYEFHYMKSSYYSDHIFFDNDFLYKSRKFGKRDVLYTERAYDLCINNYTKEFHNKINIILTNFINSNDYCINISHDQ